MTRKDYIEIAKVLNKKVRDIGINDPDFILIDELAKDFATMLKADNPNFDKERFFSAVMK
jgi:hypothetical protein